MRIAIVSPMVLGAGMSPQTYASQQLNLARCWAGMGHQVTLLTRQAPGLARAAEAAGVELAVLSGFDLGGSGGLPVMRGVGPRLRAGAFDAVLSSEHYQITTAQACVASDRVTVYQGRYALGASLRNRAVMGLLDRTCGRVARRRCLRVIAKTTRAAEHVRLQGFQRVDVLPCGYDERRFRPPRPEERREARARLGLETDDRVLLFAGNLIPLRDLPTVLHALARVLPRVTRSRLLVVGQGPCRKQWEGLARELRLAGHVRFLGLLPWEELRWAYWGADALVVPSLREIFGLVLLEGMACGLAPVCAPIPAAEDLVETGENGFVVRPWGPEALAATLDGLLGSREALERLGRAARRTTEPLGWPQVAARMLALMESGDG